jgi:hypothetical protein
MMIKRAPGVLTADFPSAKVVFNTATHMPYVLNSTASELWGFCKRPKSVESVVKYLRGRYGLDAGRAKRDVCGFIKELKARELLKLR